MIRKRLALPALIAVLALGLAAGGALADGTVGGDTTGTDTTQAGTTDGTPTDPGTDTTPTDPGTTTGDATTGQTVTGAETPPPVTQAATQTTDGGDAQPPPPTDTTTTTTPPPTAPCDTTQITCGNNAATQIAVVTQTCTALSSASFLTVAITTVDGDPVDRYTINNITSCLNQVSITQVVQQFCVSCSIVVLPPPPVQSPLNVSAPPRPAPSRAGYCMPEPVRRSDGTWGTFVDLEVGQPDRDPRYADATPAVLQPGKGYVCPQDVSSTLTAPIFTLTVPSSFVGQWLRLCLQPSDPGKPPTCSDVRIDSGASVAIPVTANVAATVVAKKVAPADRPKSPAEIAAASRQFVQGVPHHRRHHHGK